VRDVCNGGHFLGPTVRVAGRCICMSSGTNFAVARVADGPVEITAAVCEQVQAQWDCIKLMATGGVLTSGTDVDDAQYTHYELEAGVAEALRFGKPVASHAIGAAGILNAARAGVDSIEAGSLSGATTKPAGAMPWVRIPARLSIRTAAMRAS